MTSALPCIVGFGELLWDVLPHATVPGGAPANVVWHADQLGAEAVLISAVGDDEGGVALKAWLDGLGLSTGYLQTNRQPTGRVDVVLNARGEPEYVIHEDVAWDAIAWSDSLLPLAQRADCVCFGTLAQRSERSRATLHRLLGSTRPDCLRLLDVNLRNPFPSRRVLEESISFASMLKLSEGEWPYLATQLGLSSQWQQGCRELMRRSNIRLIAMTRGAEGSVLISEEDLSELPAEPVSVIDTIGAGDSFTAALAVSLLRGSSLQESQAIAARVSAFVCTQVGATPRLPAELHRISNIATATVREV